MAGQNGIAAQRAAREECGSDFRRSGTLQIVLGSLLALIASVCTAEGSRTLYPAGASGNRAELDLTLDATPATKPYAGIVARRQFTYVYANAGEYILLGSSNRNDGGDILVFNPQSFGTQGNETIPATADFTCSAAATGAGYIATRVNELAGPNSADDSVQVTGGYVPCAYQAPTTGIYGVRFTIATANGGAPTGSIGTLHVGNATVAAWEVAVRATAVSVTDIDARVFTYAFIAFDGGAGQQIYHTLYYATPDGQRYQQTMQGFDPIGYALWGSVFGFFDNGQPLYKDIRGGDSQVTPGSGQFVTELAAEQPQTPLFFSSIDPAGANAAAAATVLQALGIPLEPAAPDLENPLFNGLQSGNQTYVGGGGTFTFTAANDTTYQIVISAGAADPVVSGGDFDPANPANATLTGLAPDGADGVVWNGNANDGSAFPAGTFTFLVTGRNGEIHFPIVDDEGNKFGGPILTKLNGVTPGDTTVFYDDRGYVTRNNVAVGTLNGALCAAADPVAPFPDQALLGVDSSASTFSGANCNGGSGTCFYRYWPENGNNNADCVAGSGFGDGKALDLWSYQQTPSHASTVVINPANITLDKAGPATALANADLLYTIGLGDSTPAASGTTLTVADVLPPGVIYQSAAAGMNVSSVACTGSTALTCTVNLTVPLPGNSANGAATFTITATAPATAGTIINYASVDPSGGLTPPTPGPGCAPVASCGSAPTLIIAPPAIVKSFAVPSIQLNTSTSLSFTISNPNASTDLTGVAVSDTLPAGLTIASPDGLSGTCGGGSIAADPVGNAISVSNATLAAGSSCTFSINVTGIAAGLKNNVTGNVTSTNGGTGNTATASLLVTAGPNITLVKAGPATAEQGGTLVYTISLGNSGDTASPTTLTVADVLPAGVAYQSAAAGIDVVSLTCNGVSTLSCTLSLSTPLAAGAANGAATFTITATAPATAGTIINYASVDPTGGLTPPTPGPACAPATSCGSAPTVISPVINPTLPTPLLQILKTGPATATAGGNIVYTIAVTNIGSANATNAILTDPAPAGLAYVSAGAPCSGGFPCNLGTLTPGQSITVANVTFAIGSDVSGQIVNIASVSSDQTTPVNSSVPTVVPAPAGSGRVPIDARWLLVMLALVAGFGAVQLRRRS
jgi:large repetitive protein